jgi:hypothetical protein
MPNSSSLHNQTKIDYNNGSRAKHQQEDEKMKTEPILLRVTKRNIDILCKSTTISLPPTQSTSPPGKPTIEEKVDYNTKIEHLKGAPLKKIYEELLYLAKTSLFLDNSNHNQHKMLP